MEGIVARARAEGLKVVPICSYAVSWFRRHPDVGDVLK
jgi:predicted GNAT family acetyltransferase